MLVPSVRVVAPSVKELIEAQEKYAPAIGYLMTPVALAGYTLAFWRLGADMNWLGEFFISKGILSRWQVWLALAAATHFAANQFNRLGRQDKTPAS